MRSHPVRLGVNLDHVATIRQVRGTTYPDFAAAIHATESAGADGITLHLREDRRHIQDSDVYLARKCVRNTLNLEMAATDEMVRIACQVQPDFSCIVPERREELTTEGGLDVISHLPRFKKICTMLRCEGIRISLFIEPDKAVIDAAAETGAELIELHTGNYANAESAVQIAAEIERLTIAAEHAASLGLMVNAGHGLCRSNVQAVAQIPQIHELNIGHALIADAIFMGLPTAVYAMKSAILGE